LFTESTRSASEHFKAPLMRPDCLIKRIEWFTLGYPFLRRAGGNERNWILRLDAW
jgi:hypothetical protein